VVARHATLLEQQRGRILGAKARIPSFFSLPTTVKPALPLSTKKARMPAAPGG
jgi:hypothetical protein